MLVAATSGRRAAGLLRQRQTDGAAARLQQQLPQTHTARRLMSSWWWDKKGGKPAGEHEPGKQQDTPQDKPQDARPQDAKPPEKPPAVESGSASEGANPSSGAPEGGSSTASPPPSAPSGASSSSSSSIAPVLNLQGAPRQPLVLALPLDRRPLFPGLLHPIQITDRSVYEALVRTRASGNPFVGLFLRKHDMRARDLVEEASSDRILSLGEIHHVGTFAQIVHMEPMRELLTGSSTSGMMGPSSSVPSGVSGSAHGDSDGADMHGPEEQRAKQHLRRALFEEDELRMASGGSGSGGSSREGGGGGSAAAAVASAREESWTLVVKAHRKIQIEELQAKGPPPLVRVKHLTEFPLSTYDSDMVRALTNEVLATLRDVIKANPLLREHMQFFSARFDMSDPHHVCNFAASLTSADGGDLQDVLEAFNLEKRLKKVLTLLKKEVQLSELQQEISRQVEETISANQRRYFLNEQLKQIKKELGLEHDDKDALLAKYEDRLRKLQGVIPFEDQTESDSDDDGDDGDARAAREHSDLEFDSDSDSDDDAYVSSADAAGEQDQQKQQKEEEQPEPVKPEKPEKPDAAGTGKRRTFVQAGLPKEAERVMKDEMKKLSTLEKTSPEFNVTRAYLDWLMCLPWGRFTVENLDVRRARDVLEADHFGLKDIKERILEFIAVGNLRGTVQGKIILLVGPPGVGKTSIGQSIAHALDREFYRFSVGGLSDVSEIKGHRRTYVGSMPGKLIQCLKTVGVSNPVVLIDEIDKLGSGGFRGDPSSALLEILDPAQNGAFVDHYLDVPVDLSKVLFVCTANELDSIPGPLLDRMEVLRLSGYDLPEKVQIAKRYLEPRARKNCGLAAPDDADQPPLDRSAAAAAAADAAAADAGSDASTDAGSDSGSSSGSGSRGAAVGAGKGNPTRNPNVHVPPGLTLDESAVESLARWYCREAGVRKLEQHIERIYRKVSLELLTAPEAELAQRDWALKEADLEKYVGKRKYQSDKLYESVPPPGVVMGLAWSASGGSALYIESTCIRRPPSRAGDVGAAGKGEGGEGGAGLGPAFAVHSTGQLGEVMQESVRLAQTNARHMLQELAPGSEFFERNQIHLHVPEGATPKDGPSAGVTMTTALLSLALGKQVLADLAMTGEISLTGRVLPVGGIKEKVIAARRAGVRTMVVPDGNRKDVDELPDYLRDDLAIHFAKRYEDVYAVAFSSS